MSGSENARTLETTERSLSIAEALRARDGARIVELADDLKASKGTVYQHLATLREHGFVTKEGDEYYPGLRFATFGEYAQNRKREYVKAQELAGELADRTNLDASFVVEENGRGVYLRSETVDADELELSPHVGDRLYLHSTASGKAILSELPARAVDAVCERWGLPALTEQTITDRAALETALERVRENGYALNRGENDPHVRAVAVPVTGSDGTVLGAACVSGPDYRIGGEWFETQLPRQVTEIVETQRADW